MNVRRLVVDQYPLLREAAAWLAVVVPPPPPWDERGDWRADLRSRPPLAIDRPKPLAWRREFMARPFRLPEMPGDTMLSALNFYPPGGAGLGWHTDTGHPGWRVYLPRPLEGIPGVFLARVNAELVEEWQDEPGTALAFYVSGRPAESWHAVRADGARLSLGLRFAGRRTARDQLGLVVDE